MATGSESEKSATTVEEEDVSETTETGTEIVDLHAEMPDAMTAVADAVMTAEEATARTCSLTGAEVDAMIATTVEVEAPETMTGETEAKIATT